MENNIDNKFAKIFRAAAEDYRQTGVGANLVEDFILPAIENAGLTIIENSVLSDILSQQEEIISSPIRFNGVSVEKIKAVFRKHGIDDGVKF